jgi:hypothetical protein
VELVNGFDEEVVSTTRRASASPSTRGGNELRLLLRERMTVIDVSEAD